MNVLFAILCVAGVFVGMIALIVVFQLILKCAVVICEKFDLLP